MIAGAGLEETAMSRKTRPKHHEGQAEQHHPEAGQAQEGPQEGSAGVEAGRDELLAKLQLALADFANYRKRTQREVEQARRFANDELIGSLLGVLDDMDRGLAAGRENHSPDDVLLAGMTMIHQKALDVLARFGLERMNAVGELFDPDKHSAVLQEPSHEHPPQTVIRELQKGYRLHGRTIRPSAVVVSRPPEASEPQAPRTDSDQGQDRHEGGQ